MTTYLKTDWDIDSIELVDLYDELPLWAAPFGLRLLEGIEYRKGIKVLDVGFGAGFPLTELAMRLGSSSKVYGIDPWEAAIDRTERKIAFYGIKNAELIRGLCEAIPLADDSMDLVVSNNGLNNVSDLNQSLSECARVLKSGGQFIQTMNLNTSMMEFYTVMEEVLTRLELEQAKISMRAHIDKKRKPLEGYLAQLESHGFRVKDVKQDQFEYRFVDGSTMFNHYFIRLAFIDAWKSLVPKVRQEEIFGLVEKELNTRAAKEGGLKLSVPFAVIDCRRA